MNTNSSSLPSAAPTAWRQAARLAPLAAALWLAGCMSLPAVPPEALPATPAAFSEGDGRWTQAAPAETQARGEWWRAFADPELDSLIQRAADRNTSLQVAAARLARSRAQLGSARAERMPQLGASAGARRDALPGDGGSVTQLANVGLDLSYELDLFGRLSRGVNAAQLDANANQALLQSTRLMVQAEVAQTYLAVRALDVERKLVLDTVAAYRDTLRLTESRFRAGDVAELDVARVRTELAATESEALALDRRRATLVHALATLVGETATGFQLQDGDWTTALPVIAAGIPASVLARRPDIAASQSFLMSAQARVGVAQAAWFPDVRLTASGGQASPELSDVFKWSARTWGVGALLSLPVFDGGRRQAGIDAARADFDAALAQHREQVLTAFREVEDELSALHLLAQQADAQSRAVESAQRATALSDSRYRNGMISQLDLLDARRSELSNRRAAIQVRAGQYQATVALIRALGGGWEGTAAVL